MPIFSSIYEKKAQRKGAKTYCQKPLKTIRQLAIPATQIIPNIIKWQPKNATNNKLITDNRKK